MTMAEIKKRLFLGMVAALACGNVLADEGVVHVPAFDLPLSRYISPEAKESILRNPQSIFPDSVKAEGCDPWPEDIAGIRECYDKNVVFPLVSRHLSRYKVDIEPKTISGIYTEIIRPAKGVPDKNKNRILINLHGGGYTVGGPGAGQVESIPVAAVGEITVISIDYRMYPEYTFPAASEDVTVVYKELLKTYKPGNIGIYGCSAGANLTAQSVAWFQQEDLPMPGAIGMFCEGGLIKEEGDSVSIVPAIMGRKLGSPKEKSYHKDVDLDAPLVSPAKSPDILKAFPTSLLIASTRDQALSSVLYTHTQLVKYGIEADLHVWDGLAHAFFYHSDWPESRDAYNIIAAFFDKHLGR